ncbi:CCDC90 family protein [Candidatus Sodalis pierantonius]|uniref:CCDC90 family protein n=1 Tax=Candidatus Sodalis pierantonii TaxID=1486991 RepID=UPI0004B72C95|nr:CCDC90 family protein [Candidatus Sodalis pierantonius]
MGQVAFDTQEFVETLEKAGLPKEQAKAISIAVRKSHEVAGVATKRDLDDVRKDLSAEIADVRKDIANRFDKLGLQMTVRVGGC